MMASQGILSVLRIYIALLGRVENCDRALYTAVWGFTGPPVEGVETSCCGVVRGGGWRI